MISIVICNGRKDELKNMESYSHYLAGHLSEEEWQYNLFDNSNALNEYINSEPVLDIACIDITLPDSIRMAENIRKLNHHAHIILVATVDISPMSYMKPGIMAGSLLLRVYTDEQLKQVFEEAFRSYLRVFESDEDKEDMYVIDSREGRQVIPYSRIFYFEAREKKIAIACVEREILCYDTIASLEKSLPDYFIRCHRSFIVNKKRVKKLILSQNIIELEGNMVVPVSRSYKSILRELFRKQ